MNRWQSTKVFLARENLSEGEGPVVAEKVSWAEEKKKEDDVLG